MAEITGRKVLLKDENDEVIIPYVDQSSRADISLSNLNETGQAILDYKLNKSQITNCITEIPQDIKLELNNGALTLKAGSKVYVPNGFETDGVTPKFDVIVIPKDLTGITSATEKLLIFVRKDGLGLDALALNNCKSGSGITPIAYSVIYNTTNNLCNLYITDTSTVAREVSFPIAISQGSTSGYTSIDQVFNGFGYIGSTVFALPNVKGLIPNGFNEDGTYKSIESNITSVQIIETPKDESYYIILGNADGLISPNIAGYNYAVRENNSSDAVGFKYDSTTNKYIGIGSSNLNKQLYFTIAGLFKRENGKITSIQPKLPFRAVDYNDLSTTIANATVGFPDYANAVSFSVNTTYTAPSNGIVFGLIGENDGTVLNLTINGKVFINNKTSHASYLGVYAPITLPVKKGDTVLVNGATSGNATTSLYFMPFR